MHSNNWLTTALALLVTLASASSTAFASSSFLPQNPDISALSGKWIYVEDRTKDRPLEKQGPPMDVKFALRAEKKEFALIRGSGARQREEVVPLDGSVNEVTGPRSNTRRSGTWKDGAVTYKAEFLRKEDNKLTWSLTREFRITPDGLLVSVKSSMAKSASVALYRHPEDIVMPEPAKATIADMAWLEGAWVKKQFGTPSAEERWTPPLGGAMLGVSRTIKKGRMSAFEFLRIVERDGGLVYVAQPGGRPKTEFVLTKIEAKRAVFDNPLHSYPRRIVYQLSEGGQLTASIGLIKGGNPRRFEFTREEK